MTMLYQVGSGNLDESKRSSPVVMGTFQLDLRCEHLRWRQVHLQSQLLVFQLCESPMDREVVVAFSTGRADDLKGSSG